MPPTWLQSSGGTSGRESACNAVDIRDLGSIPGSRRSPGGGSNNWLQYSCLENAIDRGVWRAGYNLWGLKELDTTEWLCTLVGWFINLSPGYPCASYTTLPLGSRAADLHQHTYHLLCTLFYVLLSHLITITTPWGRSHYPHLINEETEA